MAYFEKLTLDERADARYNLAYKYLETGDIWSYREGVLKALNPVPRLASERTGRNAPQYQLRRVFGGKTVILFKRKVTVGSYYTITEKRVWYTDARGRSRSKIVRKRVKQRVQITVPVCRVDTAGSRNPRYFLRPNLLRRVISQNTIFPNVFKSYFDLPGGVSDLYRQIGSFTAYGPGMFSTPEFMGPVVNVSQPELSWLQAPLQPQEDLSMDALRALYTKVKSSIPDYMTAAAESPELFRALKTILKEGLAFATDLKKLHLSAISNRVVGVTPKKVHELWLSWIYGAAPAISDVQGTLDLLKLTERQWRSYSVRREKKLSEELADIWPIYYVGTATRENTYTEKWGVILEGKLQIDAVLGNQIDHVSEWIGTGYELIPFSFMLDWAVSISDYLKSCHVFENQVFQSWKTTSVLMVSHFDGKFGHNPDYPALDWSSGHLTTMNRLFAVERTPIGSFLPEMPDIKVKKPAVDMTSINRMINSFSILVSRTDGLSRPIRAGRLQRKPQLLL